MRFIVYGAGAIGLLLTAGLVRVAEEVVVIARGDNAATLRDEGLTYVSPSSRITCAVKVVGDVGEIQFRTDDVVLLSVKSQSTREIVGRLRSCAPVHTPIVCLQNGVTNEVEVLRWFEGVWGVNVGCPATHPSPGTVYSYATPGPGRLEIGRWDHGPDTFTPKLVRVFSSAGFDAVRTDDIRRAKYGKLLHNLPNAIDALCDREARWSALADDVVAEGAACLRAAGIAYVEWDEQAKLVAAARFADVDGQAFPGGSTAQSLDRGTTPETDFLNGEISLIGRLHGYPTPLNTGLQRVMTAASAVRPRQPRMPVAELAQLLRHEGVSTR